MRTAMVHEDASSIADAARVVAMALKFEAKHAIVLTGAGISVSAGVPDLTGGHCGSNPECLNLTPAAYG